MASLFDRLKLFATEQDEALNALGGGRRGQTLSGTIGRAAQDGKWWAAKVALPLVNVLMHDPTHCQQAAADEAAITDGKG
jgi:hypothetical protein